jgi:formylglycine-generating enzyme required for sulfatase activity
MKFVPAGAPGVYVSIWDTRVQDYQAFVTATGRQWSKSLFAQDPTHPAVLMSWNDATAFCKWLTEKEHKNGTLDSKLNYRLPTDVEWSNAVQLQEGDETVPYRKSGKTSGYPWGTWWPPSETDGNYNRQGDGNTLSKKSQLEGTDGFIYTSPVGSFKSNHYGLYDIGGNVWQWCEDWDDNDQEKRVSRGASWSESDGNSLLLSYRNAQTPDYTSPTIGFRCVVAPAP